MSTSLPAPVDFPAVRDELRGKGFAFAGQVIPAVELESLRSVFDRLIEEGFNAGCGRILHDGWRRDSLLQTYLPPLGSLAAALMAYDEIVLLHDVLVDKPECVAEDLPWHQEYSYWPLDRADGLTMWIALDDAGPANGCLRYAPGSHTGGERLTTWGTNGAGDPRTALPPPDPQWFEQPVIAPAPAGCAWVHHPFTWHMSTANGTGKPRRAWALSFISPEARWAPEHAPHPLTSANPPESGAPIGDGLPRFRQDARSTRIRCTP